MTVVNRHKRLTRLFSAKLVVWPCTNIRLMMRAQRKIVEEKNSPQTETCKVSPEKVTEIVDQVTGLDPLSYTYEAYTKLINQVPS